MKKILALSLGMIALLLVLSNAYAYGGGHGKYGGHGKSKGELESMFFKKAHFIMENRDSLGLSEDNAAAIKELKLETKKILIKQKADIEIVKLDMMGKLRDYPVDVEAVKKLVDQKYELKKAQTLGLVDAFAKLKGSLTKDQHEKLRTLWKDGEKKKS